MNLREAVRALRVPAVLLMAVLAGVSYPYTFAVHFPPEKAVAWKGLGVGLLAVWAAMNAKERDGWLLTATLALWAAADVVLELSFVGGAALFAAGHVVAINLFNRNESPASPKPPGTGLGFYASTILMTLFLLVLVRMPMATALLFGAYAFILFVMFEAARASGFRAAGFGAFLFAVSDWFIAVRTAGTGAHLVQPLAYAIWWLYFASVLLIALSVRATLDRDRALV